MASDSYTTIYQVPIVITASNGNSDDGYDIRKLRYNGFHCSACLRILRSAHYGR